MKTTKIKKNISEIIQHGDAIITERDIGIFCLEKCELYYIDSEGKHNTEII